ncbi:MAG: TRAP transporter large permease subunit, partial [Anaerolineae bacterium]
MSPFENRGAKESLALPIDRDYLLGVLKQLLETPSPSGYTDQVVHLTCDLLDELEVPYELTRRGSIRATVKGAQPSPDRAIVAHLDTLGAMVKELKPSGRMGLVAIGHWSSRFAEGARATLFCSQGARRGTILPLKASGHTYNEEVDSQPVNWDQVELRLDEFIDCKADLMELGVAVGDFIAIDPQPEFTPAGFIVSRHLDDKAGVAALLAAVKAVTARHPDRGPAAPRVGKAERRKALMGVIDILILFAVVLGGIYFGLLASTEAAGIGAVTALILVAARGRLSWDMLIDVMSETGKTTAMLFTIYVGALFFTEYVNFSDLPFVLEDLVEAYALGPLQVVLFILLLCLALGMVLESMSIILLMVPIFTPILVSLDVNLVWFGILLVVTTEISLITPPVGMNVFVLKSVNEDVPLGTIFRGVLPFIAAD